jgi:hypothetical protein
MHFVGTASLERMPVAVIGANKLVKTRAKRFEHLVVSSVGLLECSGHQQTHVRQLQLLQLDFAA